MIMRLVSLARSAWWNLAHRDRVDSALDAELAAYVDLLSDEYERGGLAPTDARRAALLASGGRTQLKEATRDAWIGNSAGNMARDVRFALRSLARAPVFFIIAVLTLAIGIGGATAVFTVINAALLRPPAGMADPSRMVTMERVQPTTTFDDFSYPDARDYDAQSSTLAGVAAYNGTHMALSDGRVSARAWISYVSGNFFSVLGVRPLLGRLIAPSDLTVDGGEKVIVLGYELWRDRFAADSGVIGRSVMLNAERFMVIGVTPRGFTGAMTLHPMDAFIPLGTVNRATHALSNDIFRSRSAGWLRLIGRLRPGATVVAAQSDLATIAARLAATYPENEGRTIRVYAGAGMTADERDDAGRLPRLLAIAVGLLLLLACANVASLSLVRSAAKRRELATRLALGASRQSVARHLLIEGTVIAVAAAGAGILLSQLLVRTTSVFASIVSLHALDLSIDRRVLYVTIAIAGCSALLVSLLPALEATHTDLGALMKDGAGGAVRRRSLGQRSLVVFQVATSLVLLSSALAIGHGFQRVLEVNPGFDARGVSFDYLEDRSIGYDSAQQRALYRQLYDRGLVAPEFAAVALTSTVPPQEYSTRVSVFHPAEEPPPAVLDGHEFELGTRVSVDAVSPNLFDVMRIPIVAGRAFTMRDDNQNEPVVIVSQTLAAKFWPSANPVGKYLSWPPLRGPRRAPMRVIGVASDTRHESLTAPPPLVMYVPFMQHPELTPAVLARGRNDMAPTPAQMHAFLARVDPRVPTYGASRLVDHLEGEARPQQLASRWIGAFGFIALVLAAIGLYGLLAQGVLQRTRELAVRAALGATPSNIAALVVADGALLSMVGVCVGALASPWASRGLRSMYAGVAFDGSATLVALSVMALATLAATWVPARRAARLNPVDALRCD